MKKLLLIFFIIILFLVFTAWKNSNPKIIISDLLEKGDIKSGELRYKVYLLGALPVGEAVLWVEKTEEYKGQKVCHLTATAQSSEVFSKFFSASTVLDSYVDIKELNPILFRQKLLVSGKEDIDREIFYDQKLGIMSIADIRRQILPNTQDPLSAMFNLRRMDFDKVKEFEMNINTNQKNYILEAKAEKKDLLINKKMYKTILAKAEISRRDKNPYHKTSVMVILLREKENIPIFIKIFVSGILINAKLIDIK